VISTDLQAKLSSYCCFGGDFKLDKLSSGSAETARFISGLAKVYSLLAG
jgi:hypothetical protein